MFIYNDHSVQKPKTKIIIQKIKIKIQKNKPDTKILYCFSVRDPFNQLPSTKLFGSVIGFFSQ